MTEGISLYILPPALSLLCGLYLVVLALTRGAHTTEKMLFAAVCVWYSLLAPVFICHHLIADPELILSIERRVHFFYVYLPLVVVVFVHHMLGIRRHDILLILLTISALLSWTTQGNFYISGLYKYSWGYIAKGGPAFQIFGLYGAVALAYCISLFVRRFKVEVDPKLRAKYTYVAFSFGLAILLTFLNIPAMQGVDFYPPGNFSFLPMAVLAHGLLKYRLVQIRSLVQISLIRAILILLTLVPNIVTYDLWTQYAERFSFETRFIMLAAWFYLNYLCLSHARALVLKLLYKSRYQLQQAEADLIKEMLVLSQADALVHKVGRAICTTLPFDWVRVYVFDEVTQKLVDADGQHFDLPEYLVPQLSRLDSIIEAHVFKPSQEQLNQQLSLLHVAYAVPLVQKESLIGLLGMPHKANRQPIHEDEAAFIHNIAKTLALALANALMFQRISTLKDNLQKRTEALTQEVAERKRAEQSLHEVQNTLEETNMALEMAILQANEMTAKVEISNHGLTQEMEERKRIEAALRKNEAMYRLITDNSTDVIWTIDLNGHFTYLSPSVRHHLGYMPEDALALKIQDVLTPASLQVATQVIAQDTALVGSGAGTQRKTRSLELEYVRKDGSTVWGEVNTRFIKNEGGKVSGILGITRDITDRKKSEQDLLFMAYHDSLTGLYNRKAFIELLDNEIKYAQRYQSGLALLFFDLNRFKQVNDTYGHEVGDQLLKGVTERLRSAVRESDIIFRLGGDEFTIILKTPEVIFPEIVVRRIQENLAEPFFFKSIQIGFVSASIGIATFPKHGRTVGELMKNADVAMYEAKKSNTPWLHFAADMVLRATG
jgi:diguanylate cyclase (GGDEF)-like protein/PAS domain S-box-containing protein